MVKSKTELKYFDKDGTVKTAIFEHRFQAYLYVAMHGFEIHSIKELNY